MKISSLISAASVLVAAVALAAPASALVLAPPPGSDPLTASAEIGPSGALGSSINSGDLSVTRSASVSAGGAKASASATPNNQVLLSAKALSSDTASAFATSSITYTISVSGPSGSQVLVDFNANLSAGSVVPTSNPLFGVGGDGPPLLDVAQAKASLKVDSSSDSQSYEVASCAFICLSPATPGSVALDVVGSIYATAGTDITVYEYVNASSNKGGSAYSSADPYFYIDPDFQKNNPPSPGSTGYGLVVSNGVGNAVPGAPEPATWALMMIGVGGMGAALRTRRRGVKPV